MTGPNRSAGGPAGNSYRTATFSNVKAVTSHNVKPAMFNAIRHFMLSMM